MATRRPVGPFRDQTFVAAEALAQYTIVKLASATTVSMADAAEEGIGIVQDAVASGGQAVVRTAGESLCSVNASTAITVGCGVIATTDGVGLKNTTDKAWIVGYAREALASGTGNIVVDVNPQTQSV